MRRYLQYIELTRGVVFDLFIVVLQAIPVYYTRSSTILMKLIVYGSILNTKKMIGF